jgi:hypothetical protein
MIGLLFLTAALLWLALSAYVAIHLPKWFAMSKPVARWLISAVVFLLLMVGPFVDHIVGMRQFEKLCEEQTAMTVSPIADSVKRAKRIYSPDVNVPGYLIDIVSSTATYVDLDTNQVFLTYKHFSTRGGRVAGIALMGGRHSCSAEAPIHKNHSQLWQIPIYKKIVNGESN